MKRIVLISGTSVLILAMLMINVRPVLAIDMPYLHATDGAGLTAPPDDATTLHWSGTYTAGYTASAAFGADVQCTGANCWKIDFFAEFNVEVNYTDTNGGTSGYDLHWTMGSQGEITLSDSIHCRSTEVRSPNRATCSAHGFIKLTAAQVHATSGGSEATLQLNLIGNLGPSTNAETYTLDITISAEPVNTTPCDDAYDDQGLAQDGEIDPTSETGSGVTNLDVGSDYRLSVTGGPWISADAPSINRYDTATKVDDEDWQAIELTQAADNVQCVQNSDDGHSFTIVFEATDTDFAIRVDDIVGQFANNSYLSDPITWEIVKVTAAGVDRGCAGQFLRGNLLGTYILDGNDPAGERISVPRPGGWVDVEVEPGTYWQDDGVGPQLLTVAIEAGTPPWFPLEAYPFSQCSDTSTGSYFFQVGDPGSHFLRVSDTGSNWAANTGSLTVNVYTATYDPYPSECESHYRIGDLMETKVISGNSPAGVTINDGDDLYPPLPTGGERNDEYRYLMLEITNGPYWDGLAYSAATEIYYSPNAAWYASIVFPTATCISLLDGLGRTRIYFPYEASFGKIEPDQGGGSWKFRPHDMDGIWGNNTGYIGYNLYRANLLDVVDCDQFYTEEASGEPITVMGNESNGSGLPNLEAGEIYSIETSAGPWYNNSAPSYEIAFSTDDGSNWQPVQTSDQFLCKTEDGNYITAYFQALEGANYRIRASDESETFANNTGWMHVTLRQVTSNIDPWGSCADDYTLGDEMIVSAAQRTVVAYQENGLTLPLELGNQYAVEIGDDQWTEAGGISGGGTASRMAEISDQKGTPTEWSDFSDPPFAFCVVRMPDPTNTNNDRYRIYFTAITVYSVRVDDQDGTWSNNSGDLELHYYQLTENPDPNPIPDDWSASCYTVCMRPSSIFTFVTITFGDLGSVPFPVPDVAGWIDYARCAIEKFLAWCPEHTAMLNSLTTYLLQREPFQTIGQLKDFLDLALEQANAMAWGNEAEIGGEINEQPQLMPIISDDSPWRGGLITFDAPAIGGEVGAADCYERALTIMYSLDPAPSGRPFWKGYCTAVNLLNTWETMFHWNYFVEILLGFLFIMYLRTYFKRLEELF